jgi:hypothetical protein
MTTIVTAPESIVLAGNIDLTLAFGGVAFVQFQAGTHGNTWDTQIKRYAKNIQASGGGGGGYFIYRDSHEPRVLLDPKYGPGSAIIRARDCLAVTMPNGVPAAAVVQDVESYWGFGGTQGGGGSYTNNAPFVGFRQRAKWAANTLAVVDANVWHCVVINDALVTVFDVASAISPLAPHEFEIVMDGTTNTVGFFIDSALIGSYSPASGTAPGQVTPYANIAGSAADRWNMVWCSGNVGATGPPAFITKFLSRMSPFTPLVTIEYAD